MTRKKSNVKALALAVTCAILAGGGIGLEPVYAADVQLNMNNGAITAGSVSGSITGTVDSNPITNGKITDGSITSGTFTGTVTLTGNDIQTAIASVDISQAKVGSDATSGTIESLVKNVGVNSNAIQAVNGQVTDLDNKVEVYNTNLNTKITEQVSTLDAKINTKVNASDFSAYQVKNDKAVDTLKYNTQKIEFKKDNKVTSDNATYIDGITHAGDVRLANGEVRAKRIVLEEEFAGGTSAQATLTRESIVNLHGMIDGNTKIKVADGSEVGGVTFDNKKITNVESVMVNKDAEYQVQINSEGIVVGLGSTVIGSDGVYAGGHTEANAKAVLGADGSIKGAGDGAGNYNFTVDKSNGTVTINDGGNVATISGGGISIADASGSDYLTMGKDTVLASASVISPNFFVDPNNAFEKNSLKVGDGTKGVTIADGEITTTGDATVGGNLSVAGTSTFSGQTTFSGGIKTDTIDEATTDNGVTVDGVLLKDGGVNASAMSVTGASGSLNVKDIGSSTMIYTKAADGTNTIWIDPATGNISTNGTLQVGGGVAGTKPSVTIDGTTGSIKVGQNDTEKFAVDGTTGNVKTKGSLEVASNATIGGNIKGQSLNIGATGDEFTVDANGNTTVGGTLGVTGKTTLSDELQVDKTATFGIAVGSQTVIKGDQVATGRIETDATQASKIGGVTLQNGKVTATDMTVTGTIDFKNLKVNDTLTVGTNTKITEGTLQLGTAEDNKLTAEKLANINQTIKANRVIDATSAIIGGVEIKGGNVTTATGTIQGNTISDGAGAKLNGGKITANEGKIGNVEITTAGAVSGVTSLTVNGEIKANVFKVDDDNYLNNSGITAKGGKIGAAVVDATTLTVGGTKLDNAAGITTNKLAIGGMTLTDTSLDTGTANFQVNGVTFNQGKVTAQADKGFVAGTSSFKEGSLIVDANNKLEATHGLTTEKATVNGTLDVTGKATFGTAGKQTTIDGDAITTDTLKANKLILGASGNATVEVDKDGSLKAANGKFAVDKDGALKAANGAFNVDKDGKTTFTKDADNLSSINGGNIWAKATDIADNTSSELTHDYKGLHIKGNKSGQKSAFDFDTASGIGTFTGQDNSTTKINGSAIRSEKIDGTAGRLDGENLTLYKDPNNQTTMSAGKATFAGDAGEKGGKVTTINGGTISTDTLNVERINLGEDILDSNGNPHGSNLSMDKQGNFSAAGGNFKVTGGSGADKGAFTNTVGNTTLQTDNAGASMKFDNTAATGGVESKVTVEANKATVAAGDKASFVAAADNGGTATITGGTQTVTTTDKGTVFENSAHKTEFVENGATNTIINGNEITTGKITTDQLVITGQGNAHGNGSIAFGGNGTIKSDINDGTTDGKNTSFETTLDGVNTKVTNGTTTTENKVTAEGNSNTVKQDDKHKSEFNQGLTSIGGVVTNGEIKVAQKLDGAAGKLTGEVTDANGSSKLVQNGTGLEYTDNTNADNATRINSSDVSIGSATEPDKRINLSDLGQIDELDKEIRDNEVYKSNETAVGGINAEAAIRRGEVERLDNRISEEVTRLDGRINDVNDRVNKVGAMAAAIASLKSIGYDPQAPSEFSIGLGQYKGETGVAMGFFHYPNKNFMINVSLSTAGGETMGGIGATWRFGHKSPQKLLEEQREEQAKKELAAAEKYQAAAKLAKEAQERAEYAAKLARQAQVSADNAKAAADATQAKHFG